MHFLPTVYVTCETCGGKRFTKETLEIKYKKKNIHEILEMTIEEAVTFFEEVPAVSDRLNTLADVGLKYVKLGQSATISPPPSRIRPPAPPIQSPRPRLPPPTAPPLRPTTPRPASSTTPRFPGIAMTARMASTIKSPPKHPPCGRTCWRRSHSPICPAGTTSWSPC